MSYRTFLYYVVPSVLALTLSGVYAIADGFFVGNRIGDAGLSAINFAYPVTALLEAVGAGIGMGGAVHYSLAVGRGDTARARAYGAAALRLLLLAGAALSLALYVTAEPLLRAMGAEGPLLALGTEYNRVITAGGALQILGVGLVPLLRNRAGSLSAAAVMVTGFGLNIFLDYWFVWEMDGGMTGAAFATILGQGAAALLGAGLLFRAGALELAVTGGAQRLWRDILAVGAGPFGLAMTPNISLVLVNGFTTSYGGPFAVAVYAVIAYAICIVYLALQGVGEGSQPLMSLACGRRDGVAVRRTERRAVVFALVLASGSGALFWQYGETVSLFMGVSAEAARAAEEAYPIFIASLPFIAVNRVAAASFYAAGESRAAQCLSYAEPVFLALFALVLAPLGGTVMVWWSVTFARIAAAILALWLRARPRAPFAQSAA